MDHADVVEITSTVEDPSRLSAKMLFVGDAVAGNKMAAFVEMKVRRCCLK